MPITAVHEQNDARGTARLLAQAAQTYIEAPERDLDREVALNNVYRLLEGYRSQAFFGLEPGGHTFPLQTSDDLSLVPPSEQHVDDVRRALDLALSDVFGNQPADSALDEIESVLRGIAYPDEFPAPSSGRREKAKSFFEHLLRHLHGSL